MLMSRAVRALAATVALAAGPLTIGGAGAARAAQVSAAGAADWAHCESGDWCMWDHDNAGGDVYYDSTSVKHNPNLAAPGYGWNDRVSSVANMTTRNICVYWDKDYAGNSVRISPGGRVNLPVSWRNQVTSYRQLPAGISSCVFD